MFSIEDKYVKKKWLSNIPKILKEVISQNLKQYWKLTKNVFFFRFLGVISCHFENKWKQINLQKMTVF